MLSQKETGLGVFGKDLEILRRSAKGPRLACASNVSFG
jgi:hypothetical protein